MNNNWKFGLSLNKDTVLEHIPLIARIGYDSFLRIGWTTPNA